MAFTQIIAILGIIVLICGIVIAVLTPWEMLERLDKKSFCVQLAMVFGIFFAGLGLFIVGWEFYLWELEWTEPAEEESD